MLFQKSMKDGICLFDIDLEQLKKWLACTPKR